MRRTIIFLIAAALAVIACGGWLVVADARRASRSHAGQLLGESSQLQPEDRRLIDIITTNAGRVSDIINNVLQMSRREATP